jgi:hypothetical protein
MSLGTDEFEVRCHCGKVTGRFRCCSSTVIPVIQCNCSDCGMRRNDHYNNPSAKLCQHVRPKITNPIRLYTNGGPKPPSVDSVERVGYCHGISPVRIRKGSPSPWLVSIGPREILVVLPNWKWKSLMGSIGKNLSPCIMQLGRTKREAYFSDQSKPR